MNIYETFENSLVKTMQSVFNALGTDCLVTIAHENAPEPQQPYCVINTLRLTRTGNASSAGGPLSFDGTALKEYTVQHYEGFVQVSFFGEKAAENSMDYYSQFSGNTIVREHYTRNKLAARRISDLRRNPQLRDTRWVDSFAFDLTLGFAVQTVQDIDWVEKIVVNGETIELPSE